MAESWWDITEDRDSVIAGKRLNDVVINIAQKANFLRLKFVLQGKKKRRTVSEQNVVQIMVTIGLWQHK